MDLKREINKMKENPKNVDYNIFIRIALELGFIHRQGRGSHEVLGKVGINKRIVIQRKSGKVKPYQVKQFIKMIEKYNMLQGESLDE